MCVIDVLNITLRRTFFYRGRKCSLLIFNVLGKVVVKGWDSKVGRNGGVKRRGGEEWGEMWKDGEQVRRDEDGERQVY